MSVLTASARLIARTAAVTLSAAAAFAAPPGQQSDWPCAQRLVPTLTVGEFWSGPPAPAGVRWQDDEKIAAVVNAVAPRSVPLAEGEKKLAAFAAALAPDQRKQLLPEVFAGLVDEINEERQNVIFSLQDLDRRQKSIAALVNKVTDEENGVPLQPHTVEAARQDEINQRREFLIRMFRDTQQTVRYACQVPAELEARLGAYARTLQSKL
jgi:hypothetical protein